MEPTQEAHQPEIKVEMTANKEAEEAEEEESHQEQPAQVQIKKEPGTEEKNEVDKEVEDKQAGAPTEESGQGESEAKEGGEAAGGAGDEDEDDDEDDDDEDDIKVTIEDYSAENKAAIQKQPQQAKQAAPAILEANQSIVDINTLEEKPWRKPGADINDYFNYGFDEPTWKLYCDKQKKMKNIVNEMVETHAEIYRIPVVGHNDMMHNKHDNHSYQIPVVPSMVQPVVIQPPRDQHMRDLSPIVEQQSHGRSRRGERQHQQISPPMHQQPPSSSGVRSSRDHRDVSSHRHSRSPHTKERERKHSSGHLRKGSKSRERRRSRSKETKKRRSRSREREDDRRSKRHKSSRRA